MQWCYFCNALLPTLFDSGYGCKLQIVCCAQSHTSCSPACGASLTLHPLVLRWTFPPTDETTAFLTVVKPVRQGQRVKTTTSPHYTFVRHGLSWSNPTPVDRTSLSAAPCQSPPESSLWFPVAPRRRIFQLPRRSPRTVETSQKRRRRLKRREIRRSDLGKSVLSSYNLYHLDL